MFPETIRGMCSFPFSFLQKRAVRLVNEMKTAKENYANKIAAAHKEANAPKRMAAVQTQGTASKTVSEM